MGRERKTKCKPPKKETEKKKLSGLLLPISNLCLYEVVFCVAMAVIDGECSFKVFDPFLETVLIGMPVHTHTPKKRTTKEPHERKSCDYNTAHCHTTCKYII